MSGPAGPPADYAAGESIDHESDLSPDERKIFAGSSRITLLTLSFKRQLPFCLPCIHRANL